MGKTRWWFRASLGCRQPQLTAAPFLMFAPPGMLSNAIRAPSNVSLESRQHAEMAKSLFNGRTFVRWTLVKTGFLIETHIGKWQFPQTFAVRNPGRIGHKTVVLLDPFLDLQVSGHLPHS